MKEGKNDLVMHIVQDDKVREEYYKKYSL